MGTGLKMFRCRFRAGGRTTSIECLAPSAQDAAYVVGSEALKDAAEALGDAHATWVQVVVSQWMVAVGAYVDPANAIMITRDDPAPPGASRVILQKRVSFEADGQRD